jgi:HEAT repeat protein
MGGKAIRGVTDSLLENLVRTSPVCVALLLLYAVKIDEPLKMAHSDASPQVRGQAIFWLGQSKDPRALEYLEAILKR